MLQIACFAIGCGATFGFGGKLLQFGADDKQTEAVARHGYTARILTVSQVVSEKTSVDRSLSFDVDLNSALSNDSLEHQQQVQQYQEQQQYQQQQEQLPEPTPGHTNLMSLCNSLSSKSNSSDEEAMWKFMRILFESDAREQLLLHLGYDKNVVSRRHGSIASSAPSAPTSPQQPVAASPQQAPPQMSSPLGANDAFDAPPPAQIGDSAIDGIDLAAGGVAATEMERVDDVVSPPGSPKSQDMANKLRSQSNVSAVSSVYSLPRHDNPVDNLIKQALLVANFDAAVDCCLENDKLADALLLATCGGEALWQRTLDSYLHKQMKTRPYMSIVSAIIRYVHVFFWLYLSLSLSLSSALSLFQFLRSKSTVVYHLLYTEES